MAKIKDTQFSVKNLKMKREKDNFFYLLECGFEPQIFSNFPANNLNFHLVTLMVTRSNLDKELKISRI